MNATLKIGLAVFLVLLLIGGCEQRGPTSDARQRPEAPAFSLTDHTGQRHDLADYRGQIVVLEWVNPECPFVVRHYEAETMTTLANAYAEQDVVWLAINTTSHFNQEMNKVFVEEFNLPYPVLDDSDGTVGRRYGAQTTPQMVIVDKDGRIAYNGAIDDNPVGTQPQTVNYVSQALDQLLAGQPVTLSETQPYGCSVKYPDL